MQWRFLPNCASFSYQLAMDRSAASRTPRYHLLAFFAAAMSAASRAPPYNLPAFFAAGMGHRAVSAPNSNEECSVDPSVAGNALKSSTRHVYSINSVD